MVWNSLVGFLIVGLLTAFGMIEYVTYTGTLPTFLHLSKFILIILAVAALLKHVTWFKARHVLQILSIFAIVMACLIEWDYVQTAPIEALGVEHYGNLILLVLMVIFCFVAWTEQKKSRG